MEPTDPFKLIGTVVDGRYRIERVAGRGGYGVVYRAFHLSFESSIALKVLKLPDDPTSERRTFQLASFQREGKVLFELSLLHPSIVRALEAGVVALFDGSVAPYLALEWLDGVSLDLELKHRRKLGLAPMTLREVIALLHEPAQALALAHARGIVHRDIKPGNLFAARTPGGPIIKILDFGVAKLLGDSTSTTTRLAETGPASSFTPMYAAPEQWLRRLGATGTWTDVHAWALVCVELLTGKVPLLGEEAAQYMAACLDLDVRPTPGTLGVEVPDQVESVLRRALAVHPRERFRDVGEFWTELLRASGDQKPLTSEISVALLCSDEVSTTEPSLAAGNDPLDMPTTRATVSRSVERSAIARRSPGWPLALSVISGLITIVALMMIRAREVGLSESSPGFAVDAGTDANREQLPGVVAAPVSSADLVPPLSGLPDGRAVSALPDKLVPRDSSRSADPKAERPKLWFDAGSTAMVPVLEAPPIAAKRYDGGMSLEQLMGEEELMHRR